MERATFLPNSCGPQAVQHADDKEKVSSSGEMYRGECHKCLRAISRPASPYAGSRFGTLLLPSEKAQTETEKAAQMKTSQPSGSAHHRKDHRANAEAEQAENTRQNYMKTLRLGAENFADALQALEATRSRNNKGVAHAAASGYPDLNPAAGAQFTCFTSTKVHILTPRAGLDERFRRRAAEAGGAPEERACL